MEKKENIYLNYSLLVLIAVAFSPAKPYEITAWAGINQRRVFPQKTLDTSVISDVTDWCVWVA